MDTPCHDGTITVVAKMQLEVKVALRVFCAAEGVCVCTSLMLLLGVPHVLLNQMCTKPFARRNGKVR